MIAWLRSLVRPGGYAGVGTLLRRWLLTVLFLVFLGIPAFGWFQYRQAQTLERLTAQSFNSFEWDAFKLQARVMSLREALLQVLLYPQSPQQLASASNEYNLFAAQVSLIQQSVSRKAMDDQPIFHTVLDQALAFVKRADPVLEYANPAVEAATVQALFDELSALRVNAYHLAQQTHDVRSLRSVQMIKEVESVNYYFAALSSVIVILGVGWALFALRTLKLSSQRQQELDMLYSKSNFNASHDFLTGLANRRLLYDQLRYAMASSKRHGHYGVVILLDFDGFKPVNDHFGHDVGDALLVEAASRMKQCVRDVDTVARVGGDEFVVLLAQVDGQKDQALDVASVISLKLLHALSAPYALEPSGKKSQRQEVTTVCTASLGVALFFQDSMTVDQIMQAADAAMYRAKQGGGNRIELAT